MVNTTLLKVTHAEGYGIVQTVYSYIPFDPLPATLGISNEYHNHIGLRKDPVDMMEAGL